MAGGAALAVGDVVMALENSIYSVISPEGAASILRRSADYSQQAAVAMRLDCRRAARWVSSMRSCQNLLMVRRRIRRGGARLKARITAYLDTLAGRDRKALVDARYAWYRQMGEFSVATPAGEPQPEQLVDHRLKARARVWVALHSPGRPRPAQLWRW